MTISKNNKMMAHLNFRMKVILQDGRNFVGYFKGKNAVTLGFLGNSSSLEQTCKKTTNCSAVVVTNLRKS